MFAHVRGALRSNRFANKILKENIKLLIFPFIRTHDGAGNMRAGLRRFGLCLGRHEFECYKKADQLRTHTVNGATISNNSFAVISNSITEAVIGCSSMEPLCMYIDRIRRY